MGNPAVVLAIQALQAQDRQLERALGFIGAAERSGRCTEAEAGAARDRVHQRYAARCAHLHRLSLPLVVAEADRERRDQIRAQLARERPS